MLVCEVKGGRSEKLPDSACRPLFSHVVSWELVGSCDERNARLICYSYLLLHGIARVVEVDAVVFQNLINGESCIS